MSTLDPARLRAAMTARLLAQLELSRYVLNQMVEQAEDRGWLTYNQIRELDSHHQEVMAWAISSWSAHHPAIGESEG